MYKYFTLSFYLILGLFPLYSHGALLYIDPPEVNYGIGDTFSVKIRLNSEGQCINAGSINISFPRDVLKVADVIRGESIFNLWVEDPKIDNSSGMVTLVGGIPGGYCGRVEGDPGLTNVIAELIFQASDSIMDKESSDGVFDIVINDSSQLLVNDGRGTKAELSVGNAKIIVSGIGSGKNVWLNSLKNDNFPPDQFNIELYRQDNIVGGKYFISFNTLDKQSGIDHFEIEESDIQKEGFERNTGKSSSWKIITSPYVLKDQTLNSTIKVKAIDKAGNYRIAVYTPDESMRFVPLSSKLKLLFYSIFFIIPVISPFIVRQYRRRKRKDTGVLISSTESGNDTKVI